MTNKGEERREWLQALGWAGRTLYVNSGSGMSPAALDRKFREWLFGAQPYTSSPERPPGSVDLVTSTASPASPIDGFGSISIDSIQALAICNPRAGDPPSIGDLVGRHAIYGFIEKSYVPHEVQQRGRRSISPAHCRRMVNRVLESTQVRHWLGIPWIRRADLETLLRSHRGRAQTSRDNGKRGGRGRRWSAVTVRK